ncbi:MAG: AMP-binding protein [Spirochaetes bacterium]|uniref:AMP-binding protein n=1 Tax=Candidatus Ornithospirochaeta stercoravium TaxID=2840897 RepID=A0A9D9IB92_9SPIO|nr:AMP-binding protein [Candidatus Ornithospirochaeta stercoravium]
MMYAWDEIKEFRDKGAVKGEWPTIPELFEMALARFPERPCFTVFEPDRKDLTYKQAYEKIMKGAAFLVSKGIQAGDRVLLNGKNSPEWAIGYFSILVAGGIVVPIDNQMHIDRCMRLSEYAKVRFAICDFDVLEKMKGLGGAWYDSLLGFAMLKGKSEDYPKISDLDIAPLEKKVERSEFDDAAILFTSGTTGNEKGAVLSHRNITSNVYQAANGMHVDETDVLYALLPLHHSYCCTAVLLETIRHGADCLFGHGIIVSRMIADMKMGKVTVFMGIPLLYNKVIAGIFKQVKAKGPFVYGLVRFLMIINGWCKKIFGKAPFKKFFDKMITSKVGLDHSKVLICGAGPLSPTVFKQYQQLGLNFLQGYGLTETAPILTLNPPEHFKIDSVGRVLNFIDMKIADKDSEGVGEIRVKGPNICRGYLDDEENTKALFDEEGYLRTGDLGYLDSENYLYLKGRAKNIIVTEGGKNVFPEEIEDMFQLYQQIDQILIRGYQQKKDVPCESIEAVIYPSDEYYKDKGMTKEAIEKEIEGIVTEVNRGLVGYKKIEKVTFVDKPMEVTTTKKIKRGLVK